MVLAARPFSFLVPLLVLAAGCGEHRPLDRTSALQLTIIAVPPAAQPGSLTALNLADLLYEFGAVGRIAATSVETVSGNELTEATRREGGIDLGAELTASIAKALEKQGYRIASPATAPSRPIPNKAFPDYAGFRARADAVLDIIITDAGYRGTLVLPYRPFVRVSVHLVVPDGQRTLYSEQLAYDSDTVTGRTAGRSVGHPDAGCTFQTKDDLMKAVPHAIECLRTGVELTARTIAIDLQRGS